ncbi:MAG: sigma 54-interacting transcriptional regulator [Deltaproteobacteria bacterium]|nr:sigma 54-interacting transcriptional regulator [Deltaproteobacteria bacterium]
MGPDASTLRSHGRSSGAELRMLLVLTPTGPTSLRLPEHGTLTIGRGEADVVITDPEASRLHVRLHVGAEVEVEDLASANGTRLDGQPLPASTPVPWSIDSKLEIGSTLLLLHRFTESALRPRLRTHGYFEARLEDECARNARGPRLPFGVLRLAIEGDRADEVISTALATALKPNDVAAAYGAGYYEILIVEATRQRVEAIGKALEEALKAAGCFVERAQVMSPDDGKSAEELLGRLTARLEDEVDPTTSEVIVEAPVMRELYGLVDRVAKAPISVLLLGETGVGKELIAAALHERSRRSGPFVRINCAALSEQLIESELFGHEKGAFTGAESAKTGLLELADQGTIFLDEVGELAAGTQAKLLRALEERSFLRVGGTSPRSVEVRVVAATNRDLPALAETEGFRADLYYRLNGITLVVPPLRDRVQEILPMARWFARRFARSAGLSAPTILPEAEALLEGYRWPGNVRELRNAIERAVLLAEAGGIAARHLPMDKLAVPRAPAPSPPGSDELTAKRKEVVDALQRSGGNQKRAAELLGVSRQTFAKWMFRCGLPRPRKGG